MFLKTLKSLNIKKKYTYIYLQTFRRLLSTFLFPIYYMDSYPSICVLYSTVGSLGTLLFNEARNTNTISLGTHHSDTCSCVGTREQTDQLPRTSPFSLTSKANLLISLLNNALLPLLAINKRYVALFKLCSMKIHLGFLE